MPPCVTVRRDRTTANGACPSVLRFDPCEWLLRRSKRPAERPGLPTPNAERESRFAYGCGGKLAASIALDTRESGQVTATPKQNPYAGNDRGGDARRGLPHH